MILSSDVKFPMKILLFFECLTVWRVARQLINEKFFWDFWILQNKKKSIFSNLKFPTTIWENVNFYTIKIKTISKKNFFCDDKTKRRRQNFTKKIKSNHEMDFHSGNWLLVDKIKQAEKKISGKTTNNWSNWFDMQWNWFAFISSSFQFLS